MNESCAHASHALPPASITTPGWKDREPGKPFDEISFEGVSTEPEVTVRARLSARLID
jgi:hypothetical protein